MPSLNTKLATAPNTTSNFVLRATSSTTIGNSTIQDDGTNVAIGTTPGTYKLNVSGTGNFTGALSGTSATFSGNLEVNGQSVVTNAGTLTFMQLNNTSVGGQAYTLVSAGVSNPHSEAVGTFYIRNSSTSTTPFKISSTGVATFSSSVTATQGNFFQTAASGFALTMKNRNATQQWAQVVDVAAVDDKYFGLYDVTNSAYRMVVTNGGNVGIGQSTPSYLLDLKASATPLRIVNTIATSNQQAWIKLRQADSSNFGADIGIDTTTGGDFVIGRNDGTDTFTEAFRIKRSNGNVGIGTTGPSYQLQLSTDSAAKPTSALWTIASDERIKENINPYNKGLEVLLKINPITYDYNGLGGFVKGKGGVGIIAQEIIDILPDSVSSIKAKLNETDEEETDILNFNGHELIYVLINSIKEQQAQIEAQQQQINSLINR